MPARSRKKTKTGHWPCVVCCENCDINSVQCDSCSKWVHAHCEGLINSDLKFLSGLSYMCRHCISVDDRDSYSYNSALFRLREAADLSLDHLHVAVKREKTLMPANFQDHESFNRSQLHVDYSSLGYLEFCQGDIQINHQPVLTTGDGNCLFNALSTSLCGTERLSEQIRVRTCVEMVTNKDYYVSQGYVNDFLLCSPSFDEACLKCATPGGYSSAWTIQSAAEAIHRDIYSVYPKVNGKLDQTADILTRVHSSRQRQCGTVSIMWTKLGPHFGNVWLPNHFVSLVATSDHETTLSTTPKNTECEAKSATPIDVTYNVIETSETNGSKTSEFDTNECDVNEAISYTETQLNSTVISDFEENVKDSGSINEISDIDRKDSETENSDYIIENVNQSQTDSIKPNPSVQPLPNDKFMSVEDLLNIIHGDIPTVPAIPRSKKDNVFIVLDGEENITRKLSGGKQASYYDDCGVWNSKKSRTCKTKFLLEAQENGPTQIKFVHVKDNTICAEKLIKGKVLKTPLNPQPQLENIATLHRYYTILKGNDDYKKRVSWFENLPETLSSRKYVTIVEYQGENKGYTKTHGNSKTNEHIYKRSHPVTVKLVKDAVKHDKPVDVYNKLTKLDDSDLYPRDLRQCQNYKAKTKSSENKSSNAADEILNVIKKFQNHPFVSEIIHSRDKEQPLIFCCAEEQLADIRSFLKSNGGVIGIDRTFLLGRCYVTLLVYKSAKVVRKENGEPPIMLGPVMLHWDGQMKTYYRFFTYLRGILDIDLKKIEMLIGTDDEKAMTNAIDLTFPEAKRRLCTKHIKDNLLRNMTDTIPKSKQERNEIVQKIFGSNGVATANDSIIFDARNKILKDSLKHHADFLEYYEKHVEQKISEHCVNLRDELWTNNNTESLNHRLKVSTDWKPQKTDELIDKLYDVVRVQHVDVRRAIYSTGNYMLNTRFSRFKLAEAVWRSKTEHEKHIHQLKLLNAVCKVENLENIVSSDGKYSIGRTPAVAKKPGQKTRAKGTRTFTPRK